MAARIVPWTSIVEEGAPFTAVGALDVIAIGVLCKGGNGLNRAEAVV